MLCFSWISQAKEFSSSFVHNKIDSSIISLSLTQKEEEPAALILHVPLNTVTEPYGILSWNPKNVQENVCLFKGYVEHIQQEKGIAIVYLKAFQDESSWLRIAKEFRSKETFCPYFFDDEDMRPESVLADQLFVPYWCPVSGKCKLSHVTSSLEVFHPKENVHIINYCQNPGINKLKIVLRAQWIQQVQGIVNVFPWIESAFPNKEVATYTPESLKKIWPKSGTLLGNSGYRVLHSELIVNQRKHEFLTLSNPDRIVQRYVFDGSLWIFWNLKQKRKEVIQTVWPSEVPGKSIELHWNLGAITSAQAIDGWSPVRAYKTGDYVRFGQQIFESIDDHYSSIFQENVHWKLHEERTKELFFTIQSSFFLTEFGKRAFDFALQRAYKIWLMAARCCHLEIKGSIEALLGITLEHQLILEYPKNNTFSGKVTQYTLSSCQGISSISVLVSGLHPNSWKSCDIKSVSYQDASCYAMNYSDGWYDDPEKKEGKKGAQYAAYYHSKPKDLYAYGQFFLGDQLLDKIDVRCVDTDQFQALESTTSHVFRSRFLRPTSIRLHFRKLKGCAALQHHICVKMFQGLTAFSP
ncbi:hypothetical protein P618_200943 [Holospora obtusa F1]|uniref:Uncharacterized protein n=1 Tax=Holospora obtusa F1 TaxID=1399147 RepID=W6TSX0_HOLOB|nr:hypothetical protein [Holospora obtusa]ETZ06872.1 hypothetical protein P618_200943 [Holospora obtusa F1]